MTNNKDVGYTQVTRPQAYMAGWTPEIHYHENTTHPWTGRVSRPDASCLAQHLSTENGPKQTSQLRASQVQDGRVTQYKSQPQLILALSKSSGYGCV
jgi:hypothetical protein